MKKVEVPLKNQPNNMNCYLKKKNYQLRDILTYYMFIISVCIHPDKYTWKRKIEKAMKNL